MPREIKMPKLSDTMEEGTLNVWRKAEGDRVEKGDVLVEIETDKADMEFEAYTAGILAKVLVPAGETVHIGTPIAVVRLDRDSDEELEAFLRERGAAGAPAQPAAAEPATPGAVEGPAEAQAPPPPREPAPAPRAPAPQPATAPRPAPVPAELPEPTSKLAFFFPDPDRVRATPRARLIAAERGADLSEIAGSGPDGAIRVSDVERYLADLEAQEEPLEGDVRATPVALRIAETHHVDLAKVKATGAGGRVTKRDIRDHLEREVSQGPQREASLYGDELKLSQKRKFLIRNMVESKKHAPHFYVSRDVDARPLRDLRERLKAEGRRVTWTHLIMKAAAISLERHPAVNATYRDDRILRFNPINIALAVDVQDELLAPVVKDCQGLDLEALAARTDALVQKAREKKLAPEDYSDGTFTISNLGMLGIDHFYAIITPPQSMVLSVGSLRTVPVVGEGGAVEPGLRIDFGLACDHRVLDGARAAHFLAELKEVLEQPAVLLGREGDDGG